ncbi:MAG: hypothetical protein M1832_005825 [Thelocarpon impressellum]|nr:MAG: hypothetical protein M1832_005825 [Thelocarpon impressellum]
MGMDSFQRTTQAFMEWFMKAPNTIVNPKVRLADLRGQGAGRGLGNLISRLRLALLGATADLPWRAVATEDIEVDDTLFVVPFDLVMCVETSEKDPRLQEPLKDLGDDDDWLPLIVVMMYEFLKGPDSRWKPYFDVLPDTFDTLMYWSDAELVELQASHVLHNIGKDEADESFHMDEYHGPKAMIPLADMLNGDASLFNARVHKDSDGYVMAAFKPIKKGQEVLNFYGCHPRSELLRRYGYITDGHTDFDIVELPLADMALHAGSFRDRGEVELAELAEACPDNGCLTDYYNIGRRQNTKVGHRDYRASSIPFNLKEVLSLFLMSDERIKEWRVDGDELPEPIETPELASVLLKAVSKKLKEYPTTPDQDKALLRRHLPPRTRLAIEIRLGEKRVLEDAITEISFFPLGPPKTERDAVKKDGDSHSQQLESDQSARDQPETHRQKIGRPHTELPQNGPARVDELQTEHQKQARGKSQEAHEESRKKAKTG